MTPGAGVLGLRHGHIIHIVKMHYFFKLAGINQKNYVYSNDDQGRAYQNCKFHVLVLGHDYMSYCENA